MLISAYVIQAVCLYTVNFFIFVFVTEKVYDGLFDMIMLAWYIMKNKIYIYINFPASIIDGKSTAGVFAFKWNLQSLESKDSTVTEML